MNNLFKQRKERLNRLKSIRESRKDKTEENSMPVKKIKCPSCGKEILKQDFVENLYVCPFCGYHHPISAYVRLSYILDHGSFHELNRKLVGRDPLEFPDYALKLAKQREKTGLSEAVVTCTGKIDGRKAVFAVMDSRFLMGSMGVAVGEKITRAIEYAQKSKLPLIIFAASGGARMQEGILSLMQMAKTSAAIENFSKSGGLYIAFLTHPTTGGVSASFAGLGDITLAEPGALIGFAGPRVIEQTIGEKLPEGFQRAEYLEEHGFLDHIISRSEMRDTLSLLLRFHDKKGKK